MIFMISNLYFWKDKVADIKFKFVVQKIVVQL